MVRSLHIALHRFNKVVYEQLCSVSDSLTAKALYHRDVFSDINTVSKAGLKLPKLLKYYRMYLLTRASHLKKQLRQVLSNILYALHLYKLELKTQDWNEMPIPQILASD